MLIVWTLLWYTHAHIPFMKLVCMTFASSFEFLFVQQTFNSVDRSF